VVINVHNDQADTTFISDNAEVRQALQDGMDNLRNKMSESGVQLGQANVSSGQQAQQQFQQAMQNRQAAQVNRNQATSGQGSVDDARTLVRVSNGLVDTFA
jgi:flagellar hook-length control protein FliK